MSTPRHILIVEDSKESVDYISQILKNNEYPYSVANNGAEAIEAMKEKRPDLVLLDLHMPVMNGLEALRQIKQRKPLIEVIMLTGHGTMQTAIDGMKLGAFDFLIKPTETEELVEKIRRAFTRKAEQDRRIQEAEISEIVKRRGW